MENTPLPFLHAIETLKHLPRTGWLRTIQNPESVAAHSFRVAILAMLAPEILELDTAKCIQMALIHDLAESVIGDIPTFAKVPKDRKYDMERNGFQYLESLLQTYSPEKAKEISNLWLEYEKGETPESQWVREMDKFECLVQAHEYEQKTFGKKDLEEFQGLAKKIHSKEAMQWAEFLSQERKEHLSKRKKRLPIVFVTGDPAACEKVASQASEELSLSHISVKKILREKAQDFDFRHHKIIQSCLEKGFEVPASLVVELLENEIKAVRGQSWAIISGFPKDIEQFEEFEKRVQNSNCFLEMECLPRTDEERQKALASEKEEQTWRPSGADLTKVLMRSAAYFQSIGSTRVPISETDLCGSVLDSIKSFIMIADGDEDKDKGLFK